MQVGTVQQTPINFKNAGAAAFLEENVFLNKALLDASVDIPFVCFANNKTERRERTRRVLWNYTLVFLSPFVSLPLTSKFAMKYIAKLSKSFSAPESDLIKLSNKYLTSAEALKQGIKELPQKLLEDLSPKKLEKMSPKEKEEFLKKYDFTDLLKNNNYDYEKIRKKLIDAKMSVLAFDFLFSTGSVAGMAFLNNALTKKKTNMDGYSAEFELADRETVEKRAAKYKKSEPLRKGITAGLIGLLTLLPLAIRKGLISDRNTDFVKFVKKHADKFDYTKGIFMKRLPLFLFLTVAMTGVAMASRNQTEVKNNLILNGTGLAVYFGGDVLINSTLARLSDKFLKTQIIDKTAPKTFMNKIIPPTVPIKKLSGKSQKIAKINFWLNFVTIAAAYGFGVPNLINKIVRKDLKNDKTA